MTDSEKEEAANLVSKTEHLLIKYITLRLFRIN